jgi:UDP-glucose 4-epimerase
MRYFVTGGAGFIGSNFVARILKEPENSVTVYDNFSTGKREFLAELEKDERLTVTEGDLLDFEKLKGSITGHDIVFHFAANADVRTGVVNTDVDLNQGVKATFNLLEAMRLAGLNKIAFTSSSTVYGEALVLPTPEQYGPLVPISLYGAAKLSAEAFAMAFASSFDFKVWIFRLANVIGNNGTHGVIVDFINKLRANPSELEILGDGKQEKSYLLVDECVEAILYVVRNANENVNIFNLGSSDKITVVRIADLVVDELGLEEVKYNFTGGSRGWTGDVALMILDTKKIQELGFEFKINSENAVRQSIKCVLSIMDK